MNWNQYMKNRNELPNFFKMPNMKVDTEKLLKCFTDFKPSKDQLVRKCGPDLLNDEYEQTYITYSNDKSAMLRDKADERTYTNLYDKYKGTYVEEVLNSFKSPYTRTRLIVQKPGAYILPHMDYDTRFSVRFFIPLVVNDWSWVAIQRKGKKLPEFQYMPADGSVWFVNVGHKHSAFNFGKTDTIKFIVSVNGQKDLDVIQ